MSKPQVRRMDEPHVPARPSLPGAGRFSAPIRPVATRRRPALIALGAALVVVGSLGMVAIVSSLGKTQQVLAVTAHLSRGDVITAQDLTVAEIPVGPTSLATVPKESMDEVVGQVAATELSKGGLLTPSSYAKSLVPDKDLAIVGVALDPSQMPIDALRAGDNVQLVEIPPDGEDIDSTEYTVYATVVSVSRSTLSDKTLINVEVDKKNGEGVVRRAAAGKLALMLIGAHQ